MQLYMFRLRHAFVKSGTGFVPYNPSNIAVNATNFLHQYVAGIHFMFICFFCFSVLVWAVLTTQWYINKVVALSTKELKHIL